jgi:hypothetical protein
MKLLLLLISQVPFARAYGGADHDWAVSIAQAEDGGFAVAGSTWGFGSVWIDLLFLKLSPSGTIEWGKTYRGDGPEWASGVFQAQDGGYAVVGHTRSFGAQGTDLIFMRLSPNGEVEMARIIGGEGYDYAGGACQTSDSGYVITGGRYRGPEGWDLLLVKLSSNGDLEWAKTLDGGGFDYGESVIQTRDGGFAVAGWTLSFGSGYSDFLVARFSPLGKLEWVRAYGGPEHDAANAILQTQDGGFLVAGETWGSGAGLSDILLLKIRADGSLEWGKTYGGPGIDRALSAVENPEGEVVLGQTTSFGEGLDDALLMKIFPDGGLEWAETFGGKDLDSVGRVISLGDGGFAIVGSTGSYGSGLSDIFVLRVPADGSYPGCVVPCEPSVADAPASESAPVFIGGEAEFTVAEVNPSLNQCAPSETDICPPSVEESWADKRGPRVISSPFPGAALFASNEEITVKIYSVEGRLVRSVKLTRGKTKVILSKGVYIWRAGNAIAGKVVIP